MTHLWAVLLLAVLSSISLGAPPASNPTTQTSSMTVIESSTTPEAAEPEQTTSSQESESKGILPPGVIFTSTEPVTPTSAFTEKSPYEQAKAELIRAMDLWNANHFEAASDTALGAYDDLLLVRRVPGVKRSKIRAEAHQAAKIYVEAGITYIQQFVKRLGGGPTALEEGRARLGDLRDVAQNYPDLNKTLNKAIEQLSSGSVGPAN